jgi:serine protease Do
MRTWTISLSLCSALWLVIPCQSAAWASEARETPARKAIRRAKSAVVDIHSVRTDSRDRDGQFKGASGKKINGMGTGIIIDERGYIVTNQHVISGVDSLRVTLDDGSTYTAEPISWNPKQDLALIKIEASRSLPVIPLGTSSDLELGETVLAIGNAYGYEHTVTQGIISSLSRDVEVNEDQAYRNLLQTDASINPGNSGGPLLNLDGEVVGINVAIRANATRIGFAIPIDDARTYIAGLINIGQLDNTYHGLKAHDVKTRDQRKLVVDAVDANSPAAVAGFQAGDVVTQVGPIAVLDRVDLERAFLGHAPSAPVDVVVQRNQESIKLTVQLAQIDSAKHAGLANSTSSGAIVRAKLGPARDPVKDKCWDVLGLRLEKASESQLDSFRNRYHGGMRVLDVRPRSVAAEFGIKKGDILVGLHIWETVRWEDINYVLNQGNLIHGNEPLKFYVVRGQEVLYGNLKFASRTK